MPNHYWSYPGRQVTSQQGVPRGLAGPLVGCGVPPPFSLTPPPEAAQEKGDLHSYEDNRKADSISPPDFTMLVECLRRSRYKSNGLVRICNVSLFRI